MRQNRWKLRLNCLIERLYRTKLGEIQVEMSHRIAQTAFYETKSAEIEAELSHRTALWNKFAIQIG